MTSSAIKRTPYLSQMARSRGQKLAGGTITPPDPITGSAMIAATLPGARDGSPHQNSVQ